VSELEEELKVSITGATDQLDGVEESLSQIRAAHKESFESLLEEKSKQDAELTELRLQLKEAFNTVQTTTAERDTVRGEAMSLTTKTGELMEFIENLRSTEVNVIAQKQTQLEQQASESNELKTAHITAVDGWKAEKSVLEADAVELRRELLEACSQIEVVKQEGLVKEEELVSSLLKLAEESNDSKMQLMEFDQLKQRSKELQEQSQVQSQLSHLGDQQRTSLQMQTEKLQHVVEEMQEMRAANQDEIQRLQLAKQGLERSVSSLKEELNENKC
jgi:hypothetical protein